MVDLDSIIHKLLAVKSEKPGKLVALKKEEIFYLIEKAQEIFME